MRATRAALVTKDACEARQVKLGAERRVNGGVQVHVAVADHVNVNDYVNVDVVAHGF